MRRSQTTDTSGVERGGKGPGLEAALSLAALIVCCGLVCTNADKTGTAE